MSQHEPPRRRATYQDVLDAPEHLVAEIVDGVLYTSPRPALPHARAASSLGAELLPPFQHERNGPGGWWILDEPELHFGEDIVVPDVAGWRRTRMQDAPSGPFSSLPPDWLCEVLSPSTARFDRTEKLGVYTRVRVPHVWLLDPIAKFLEVLALNRTWAFDVVARDKGDECIRVAPFEAIEIDLRYVWGELPALPPASE